LAGVLDTRLGDRDRVAEGSGPLDGTGDRVVPGDVAALGRENRNAGALAHDLQLGDGIGALEVGGDEQWRVPLVLEELAELAGQGRLARALEAGKHDDGRWVLGQPELAGLATEDRDEFLVDDLDDLLRRVQRSRDLSAESALAHGARELLDHRERDIGIEEGEPDVTNRLVDVGLESRPLVRRFLKVAVRRSERLLNTAQG
jgi:hypothetical protein